MKNSLPIIKNIMIPVRISETLSLSLNAVAISPAPLSRNTIRKETSAITIGLNFASQETIIAVKPIPPTTSLLMVWSVPLTSKSPATPQSAQTATATNTAQREMITAQEQTKRASPIAKAAIKRESQIGDPSTKRMTF